MVNILKNIVVFDLLEQYILEILFFYLFFK